MYIGVSAGAVVGAGNLPNNLGYLKAKLRVHVQSGTAAGIFENDDVSQIDLTDKTAVVIRGDLYEII